MPRFVTIADVCETLSISANQAYAILHSGELRGIQVGARAQWRIEVSQLEAYIERKYAEAERMIEKRSAADR